MDKMCSVVFDGDMKEECLKTVKMEGDRMLDFVARELKWKKVCPFLGLCPPMKMNVAVEADMHDNFTCGMCAFAVEQSAKALHDPATRVREILRSNILEVDSDMIKLDD